MVRAPALPTPRRCRLDVATVHALDCPVAEACARAREGWECGWTCVHCPHAYGRVLVDVPPRPAAPSSPRADTPRQGWTPGVLRPLAPAGSVIPAPILASTLPGRACDVEGPPGGDHREAGEAERRAQPLTGSDIPVDGPRSGAVRRARYDIAAPTAGGRQGEARAAVPPPGITHEEAGAVPRPEPVAAAPVPAGGHAPAPIPSRVVGDDGPALDSARPEPGAGFPGGGSQGAPPPCGAVDAADGPGDVPSRGTGHRAGVEAVGGGLESGPDGQRARGSRAAIISIEAPPHLDPSAARPPPAPGERSGGAASGMGTATTAPSDSGDHQKARSWDDSGLPVGRSGEHQEEAGDGDGVDAAGHPTGNKRPGSLAKATATGATTTATSGLCAAPGCDRPRRGMGRLCRGHAGRRERGKSMEEPIRSYQGPARVARGCSEPGCGKRHLARGWCARHYYARKRAGTLDEVPSLGRPCGVEGCDKPARPHARLCSGHAQRRRDGRPMEEPIRGYGGVPRSCSVPGCDRPHKARGQCERHYRAARPSARSLAGVAQQAEHPPCKRDHAGSSPAPGTTGDIDLGVAQSGSAPALGAGGRRFESAPRDHDPAPVSPAPNPGIPSLQAVAPAAPGEAGGRVPGEHARALGEALRRHDDEGRRRELQLARIAARRAGRRGWAA